MFESTASHSHRSNEPTSHFHWAIGLVLLASWPLSCQADDQRIEPWVTNVLKQHCVKCHGQADVVEGDMDLLKFSKNSERPHDPESIQRIIDALELGAMPPEDEPKLDPESRDRIVEELQKLFTKSLIDMKRYPRTPIRRMNRFQYNNAVQDLFQLNCNVFTLPERILREHGNYFQPASQKMPQTVGVGSRPLGKSQMIEPRLAGVAAFPQDLRAEHGFDNRGDHLSLSPLLLESFLKLSRSILESPDFNSGSCGIWNSFFATPESDQDIEIEIRNRIEPFLRTAFRRPPTADTVTRYVNYVMSQLQTGRSFTESMKLAASAVIASPKFFYLFDEQSTGAVSQFVDDFELASRLSFFLWGGLPDETLLDLAEQGTLSDPDVLSAQVDRMLDDRKLKRFCDSFPSQWLQLDRIVSSIPDREQFPDFYFSKYRSSMHMMLEPLLVFETVLIEDRSILELVDSDFSYRSGRLSQLYYGEKASGKLTEVTRVNFQRVDVTDRRQGGVITNPAIMTMTSGTQRTQPITRGAWVATVIFNNPPDPPPADVPPLADEPSTEEKHLTLRERLAQHRKRADCAGCHQQIDPLGFALENYGPTGKWRDKYSNGREIDVTGTLFGKHEFTNVVQFKEAILTEKKRFTSAFASHLLSFAVARELGPADSIAIAEMTNNAEQTGFRMRTLIKNVVLSEPFRSKSFPQDSSSDDHARQ